MTSLWSSASTTISTARYRPRAATAIPNLALAGDYVRTLTNVASIEGACEAGRRAANAILERTGATTRPAPLWPPSSAPVLEQARRLDARLHAAGRQHLLDMVGVRHAMRFLGAIDKGLGALDSLLDAVPAPLRRLLRLDRAGDR